MIKNYGQFGFTLFLIIALTIQSTTVLSLPAAQRSNGPVEYDRVYHKWLRMGYSEAQVTASPHGKNSMFVRMVPGAHGEYRVASFVYNTIFKFKGVNDRYHHTQVASDLYRAMGISAYAHHTQTVNQDQLKIETYDGVWSKGNKIIRLSVNETDRAIRYSIAFYRPAYQKALLPEIRQLESYYLNRNNNFIQPLSANATDMSRKGVQTHVVQWIQHLFMPNSLAMEGVGGWSYSYTPSADGSNIVTVSNENGVSFTVPADTFFSLMGGEVPIDADTGSLDPNLFAQGIVKDALGDWLSASGWGGGANGTSVPTVDELIEKFPILAESDLGALGAALEDFHNLSDGVNALPGSIDNMANVVNRNWGETNAILTQFTKPDQLFLLSLSASAGMVVGSAAASMAVWATREMIKFIYEQLHELITRAKEKEGLFNDFIEARKSYEESMKRSFELERMVDNLLEIEKNLNRIGDGHSSLEKIIETINDWAIDKEYELAVLDDRLKDRTLLKVKEEWKQCKKERDQQQKLLDKINSVLHIIALGRHKNVCEVIKSIYKDLILIESTLEDYRADMLAAKGVFFERLSKTNKEKSDKFFYALKHSKRNTADAIKMTKQTEKERLKGLEDRKKFFLNHCVSELNREGHSREALITIYHEMLGTDAAPLHSTSAYRDAICAQKFAVAHGKDYEQNKREIEEATPVIIQAHEDYQKELLSDVLAIDKDPKLSKENNIAALEKYFLQVLQDKNSKRSQTILQKQETIISACQGK